MRKFLCGDPMREERWYESPNLFGPYLLVITILFALAVWFSAPAHAGWCSPTVCTAAEGYSVQPPRPPIVVQPTQRTCVWQCRYINGHEVCVEQCE